MMITMFSRGLPFVMAAWLVGCSFEATQSEMNGALDFHVLPVTQVGPAEPVGITAFKSERTFTLKTCVRDGVTLEKIAGEPFRIQGEERRTNADGCLYWT